MSPAWRKCLLAGVAAGAMVVASGAPALAACVINGTTLDCSGDLSAGVTVGPPYDTLSVTNVTGNITPASGTSGINFQVNGPLTLNVNTGAFGVSVTGADTSGVVAQSYDGSDVGIAYTGNITSAAGNGLFATGLGDISDISTGNVSADFDGIHIEDYKTGGGDITVNHTGTLTSTEGNGVYATTQGAIDITTNGGIDAEFDGIYARSFLAGTVSINDTGNITSRDGYGIFGQTEGNVSETGDGNISATDDAIHLINIGPGTGTVDHTGNLTSSDDNGVFVSTQGDVNITVNGDVSGGTNGIYARSIGDASSTTISHTGGLIAKDGNGIDAASSNSSTSVTNSGDITATGAGIFAQNFNDQGVSVSQTGHIAAQRGIVAKSSSGAVTITGTGNIDATGAASTGQGVFADSTGSSVSVNQTGYVNSALDEAIVLNSTGGPLTLTGAGAVTALGNAIDLKTTGPGATIGVTRAGAITSTNGYGLVAQASQGPVTIAQTGDITSEEDAIHVTSPGTVDVTEVGAVGSRSGKGIYAYSGSSAVNVTTTGLISSYDDGIYAQSKGTATSTVIDASGGVTSTHGEGIVALSSDGTVYLTNEGDIQAYGRGIEATSSGSATDTNIWQTGAVTSSTAEGIYATTAEGVVNVNVWGNVNGATAGIYARSGGGGFGANVNAHNDVTTEDGYGIYAFAPDGAISVAANGAVTTHGNSINDAAIFAANTGGSVPVDVTTTGTVTSDHGDAIYASAISGNVNVITSGDVTGARSGLSLAGKGGPLYAEVDGGSVVGNSGAAVNFSGLGGTSKLVNNSIIYNANGMDGDAVVATQTNTAIENYGTMSGDIRLWTWDNSFLNGAGGWFNSGDTVDLGNLGNTLKNYGVLSVGGLDSLATTTLNGTFVNEVNSGVIFDDLDLANATGDVLNVNGEADLSGKLKLNLTSFSTTPTTPIEFLYADQWINTRDITTDLNPTVMAHVSYSDDNKTAYVTVDGFDFAPAGVTGNAEAIGTYLNAALGADTSLAPIGVALANLTTVQEVTDALNQLNPTVYNADNDATNVDTLGFVNRLFSCKVADGTDMFNAEGQCNWARMDYGLDSHTETADSSGYSGQSFNMSGGRQAILAPDLRLDVGAGVVTSNLATENGAASHGLTGEVGAALKYVPGNVLLAASATGTFGAFENTRQLSFGGFTDTLSGNSQVGTVEGRIRAAYTFQSGDYYARPQLDFDAAYTHSGAVDETGTVASLHVDGADQLTLSVAPTLEVGGQAVLDDDSIFRPYVSGGVRVYSNTNSSTTGNFTADVSGDSFTVANTSDQVQWNVSTGFDLLQTGGQSWRAYYNATFGATTAAQSGGLKLSVNY